MWIPASKTLAGWAVVGVGTVAAAVHFSGPEQRNVPGPVASSPAQATPAVVAPPKDSLMELLANARRAAPPLKMVSDLFAGHTPTPAPQGQAAPLQAKPVMPPFPFKYAGWLRESSGSVKIFLERGTTVFPIKVGDVLEGFRIDAIHDERIDLTFLAGSQQSSILFASLTGGADGATALAGMAGIGTQSSPQPAAAQLGGTSAVAATAPQGFGSAGGVIRSPALAAAASTASRNAALIPQAISVAENAPPSGSMPTGQASTVAMQVGPVPSGTFPAGSAPSGKLGVEPAASGKLGSEAVPSGKLGL